jgi:hypothetical protein
MTAQPISAKVRSSRGTISTKIDAHAEVECRLWPGDETAPQRSETQRDDVSPVWDAEALRSCAEHAFPILTHALARLHLYLRRFAVYEL